MLDLVVQPDLTPGETLAEDRTALAAAGAGTASLRAWSLAAPAVSLGRYHLAPRGDAASAVRVVRRLSGGRVAAGGPGFVGLTLALPGRSALAPGRTPVLGPDQVLNRAVRGVLRALETLGVPVVYPGRDVITAGGRILATAAFEEDARGALLCETVLAVGSDLGVLAKRLDAVDHDGVVTAPVYGPGEATSLAAVAGASPSLDALADAVARATGSLLGLGVRSVARAPIGADDDAAWVAERRPRPALDRRGTIATQLGVVDCRFRVAGNAVAEIVIAGDVIAPSAGMAALEAALVGCPLERDALGRAVTDALAAPGRFLLGVWPVERLADAILAGAP